MEKYILVASATQIEGDEHFVNPIDCKLRSQVYGSSLQDAIQRFIKSKEYDEYIHVWKSVWVYEQSCFDGKIYPVPQYYDLDPQ